MGTLVVIVITLVIGVHLAHGHVRLKKVCDTDAAAVANNSIVAKAVSHVDYSRSCDVDFRCNYISYHDNNQCAMYNDDSVCGTTGGASQDVYKVDPGCASGWYRFNGSCYWVTKNESEWTTFFYNCDSLDSHPVAVSYAAEGEFLTHLLHHSNVTNTTVWLGVGSFGFGLFWWNLEPWGYVNWAEGQPDNSGGVVTLHSTDAKWQVEDGFQSKLGVCEKALAEAEMVGGALFLA